MSKVSRKTILHSSLLILVLQPLLLFFATHGGFSFEHVGSNSQLGSESSAFLVRSGGETLLYHAELTGLFAFSIILAFTQLSRIVELCRMNKMLCFLPLFALVSMLWSQDPSRTLIYAATLLINTLLVFYLVARLDPEEQMQMFVVTGAIFSLLSIMLAVVPPHYGIGHQNAEGGWRGLAPHKNIYAIESVFLLSPMLVARRGSASSILRTLYVGVFVLQIALSQSRTGWVLLIACIAVVVAWKALSMFKPKDAVAIFALAIPAMLIGAALLSSYALRLLELMGKDDTFSGRTYIWKAVLMAISKQPILGYGYSAFWSGMKGESANIILMLGTTATHAHNGFLNVWLELGVAGIGCVICLIVQAFRNFLRIQHSQRGGYILWYLTLVVMTIVLSFDEQGMVTANAQSWMLFALASAGLSRAASPDLDQQHQQEIV